MVNFSTVANLPFYGIMLWAFFACNCPAINATNFDSHPDQIQNTETSVSQTLRMTFYRGPGTTDRDLGPKVCDGDPDSEWIATGLTRTSLGPPFEFILETIDGQQQDFAGIKVLAASAAATRRLNEFEIRVESSAGSGDFDQLIYKGIQKIDAVPQSHLFDQPVRTHRFQWILKSNHGDRNEFRLNEIWPIAEAAQTAQAVNRSFKTSLPQIPVASLDTDAVSKYTYQPLKFGAIPHIQRSVQEPSVSVIDAWLLREIRKSNLEFQPEAEPAKLIRRLAFNLTGLPPDPNDIQAFSSNPSDAEYERIVEKLINSKAYGENQARLWLDVVRYADTDGYAADGLRAEAWRYRDYVIESLNQDKPYNRFLTEQLAADELPDTSPSIIPALGMARLGPFRTNSGNQNLERNRQELITEMVSNVSLSFLGLTIGCARCHDHKIDPIPQADYYRFAAYFAATEPTMLPLANAEEQAHYRKISEQIRKEMEPREAEIAAIRGKASERLRNAKKQLLNQATVKALEKPYDQRTDAEVALVKVVELELEPNEQEITTALTPEERVAISQLEADLAELRKKRPLPLPMAWGLKDSGSVAPSTFLLHRGQIENKTGLVQPRVPSAFAGADQSLPNEPKPGQKTTLRRLSLAQWMTGPGQAQVARVLVNRVWQQHFDRGIVATANNFGDLGDDPSHPELLDWLADDFIKHGWSLKHLNRQIVTSRAFRQSSKANAKAMEKDPLNQLYSRQNRRRLAAEELRDGILQSAGQLNLNHRSGPPVAPPLPPEVLQRLKTAWRPTKDQNATRARSIFLLVDRNLVLPILEEFDRPDSMTSCARRNQSTHALQSLAMMNHPWVIEQAKNLGQMAQKQTGLDDQGKLRWMFERLIGQSPSAPVQALLKSAMARSQNAIASENDLATSGPDEIWTDMALLLINSNDWFYLD